MPYQNSLVTTVIFKRVFQWLSVILLCCSLLLLCLPFISGRVGAYLELLSLCGFYVVVADLLVCLLLLLFRQKSYAVINFTALIIAIYPVIRHYPFGSDKANTTSSPVLTLVSCNIGNFNLDTRSLDEFAFNLRQYNPDIICLQERPHESLMSKDTIESRFKEYPYVAYNTREDEVLNLMVLSKYPIENAHTCNFENTYNKYLSIDLKVDTQKICLYNVHLQTTSVSDNASGSLIRKLYCVVNNAAIRNQQVELIYKEIETQSQSNIIVCGDFNSSIFSHSCQTVSSSLYDAAWLKPQTLIKSSYTASRFLPKIDHVFYKGDLVCSFYDMVVAGRTDHYMQVSRFQLK